jgi:hypothetical protein
MGAARQPVCQGEKRWDRKAGRQGNRKRDLDRLGRKAEQCNEGIGNLGKGRPGSIVSACPMLLPADLLLSITPKQPSLDPAHIPIRHANFRRLSCV